MLTTDLIKTLRTHGYRLTALDIGVYDTTEFILGIQLSEPEDIWYIAQLLSTINFPLVPEVSADMKMLGLLNVKLKAHDFESILAVY